MRLNPLGSNQNEVVLDEIKVLFSYQTPVAYIKEETWGNQKKVFKTEKKWSVTTSKHINQWLKDNGYNPAEVPTVSQNVLDGLVK